MVTEADDAPLAQSLLYPRTQRRLRNLPVLARGAVILVWRAARRELVITVALQGIGSVTLAVQVLVARQLLSHLLAHSSSRDFSSSIPSIVTLAIVLAVSSISSIIRTELQRLLSELVARYSMQQVVKAATSADLVRFESPEFHDRLQRAIINASIRPLQMTTGLLAVGGSLLGTLAVAASLLTIEPLFLLQDFNNFVQLFPVEGALHAGRDQPERVGKVVVAGLDFTYPSRTEPSLRDIDLEIEPGQVIALVGENGSGKTTLAKLLGNLYQPALGSITWDGRDLTSLDPGLVRERVAVLFQDFVHYFLSARDNITMGRWQRSGDLAAVDLAAERSQAAAFIRGLPKGYETLLGPQFYGGSDLSGGQWQRMALARVFFRDAELIILDEPTAALDPRAEAALFTSVGSCSPDVRWCSSPTASPRCAWPTVSTSWTGDGSSSTAATMP